MLLMYLGRSRLPELRLALSAAFHLTELGAHTACCTACRWYGHSRGATGTAAAQVAPRLFPAVYVYHESRDSEVQRLCFGVMHNLAHVGVYSVRV
jgi:hypothetical protein